MGKLRHGEGKRRGAEGALGLRLGSVPRGRRFLRETPDLVSGPSGFGARRVPGEQLMALENVHRKGPKGRGSAPTPPRADAEHRASAVGCSRPSQLAVGTRLCRGGSGAGAHPTPMALSERCEPSGQCLFGSKGRKSPVRWVHKGKACATVVVHPKSCRTQAAVAGSRSAMSTAAGEEWGWKRWVAAMRCPREPGHSGEVGKHHPEGKHGAAAALWELINDIND